LIKKLKIFLIVIIGLILVLTIAAIIFLMTFDINRYKAQIVSQASAALGRGVDFEKAKLAVSLSQGTSLKIINLRIAEDPAFGKDDFLAVKETSLAIDAWGLIFNKKVHVSGILIDSPRIRVIRGKDGSLNVGNLAEPGKNEKDTGETVAVSSPAALPALLISSLRVTGGSLEYIDRMLTPALSLEINQVGLEASKISLSAPFPIACEAAVLSNQKNLRLEGEVEVDLKKNAFNISGNKGRLDLSRIKLEKIPAYFPMAKDISLPAILKGQVEFALWDLSVKEGKPPLFLIQPSLKDGFLKFKELASPIEGLSLYGEISRNNLHLDEFSATLGTGKIKASGEIINYLSAQEYDLKADLDELLLQDVIIQDKSEVKIEGIVSGLLELTGRGLSPQDFKTKLYGRVELNVVKPRLKNINVLRTVLDKIGAISGLSQELEANLPERYKEKLTQKDTVLSDINIPATISEGRLRTRPIVIQAEEFRFEGWGKISFEGDFSLEGAFLIPPDLSQAMVTAASQLEYLLSTGNQIYIPLRVSGSAARFEFDVDAAYIASKLLAEQGKKQLFKVLDKALGTKEAAQEQAEGSSQEQDPKEQEYTPEEAVKGLLEEIFR
jgi:uncharacterized protein involved in outer membrane biogenesis